MKFQNPTHGSPQPQRPMSEVLLEFAQPLLGEKVDEKQFDAVMMHATLLWNMALFQKEKQEQYWGMIEGQIRKALPEQIVPSYLRELRQMLQRRQKMYPDDQRAISHHEVKWVNGEPRLKVYFESGKHKNYAG